MLGRDPGAILCAHCRGPDASEACRACGRLLCVGCAADWTSCSSPSGREIRLGLGARLFDVDPTGRYGLVSRPLSQPRRLDLHTLRWLGPVIGSARGSSAARITPDGRIVERFEHYSEPRGNRHRVLIAAGLEIKDPESGARHEVPSSNLGRHRQLGVTPTGSHAWFLRSDELVEIVSLAPVSDSRVFDLLGGQVAQSVDLADGGRLLAAGTWGDLRIGTIDGGELDQVGRMRPDDGDLRFCKLATDRVVVVVERARELVITGWQQRGGRWLAEPFYHQHHRRTLDARVASLSSDGRTLAIADGDDGLRVIDLDTGHERRYGGHSDGLCLVRFADGDRMLVSADDDNRVIVRRRSSRGDYDVPLAPASIE